VIEEGLDRVPVAVMPFILAPVREIKFLLCPAGTEQVLSQPVWSGAFESDVVAVLW